MLTLQDLQFHPAWATNRKTARDFVLDGGLADLPGGILAALGEEYLAFASGRPGDMALYRAVQCLEAAAEKGVESAREQLRWLEDALDLTAPGLSPA